MATPAEDTMVGAEGNVLRTLTWEPRGDVLGRVLVVHGLGEHAGRYGHVAEYLTILGFAVMAFDLRGHGMSEGRRGSLRAFELLVEDVQSAREVAERRLPGHGHPFLYGHSLGGLVVLRHLQMSRPPTPGVVLSAPWLGTAREVPRWMRMGISVLLRVLPDVPLSNPRSDPRALTGDEEARAAFVDDPLVHHKLSPRFFAEVERAQTLALSQAVDPSVPMLVLAPMEDALVDTEVTLRWASAKRGERITVLRLDGTRHEPHNDVGRRDVIASVGSWLERTARGQRG